MNIDLDREICVCNSLTIKEIAELIKAKDLKTLEAILENEVTPIGDKCEACRDEGFENDGFNIPMVLSLVKSGRI
jgi:bacterioferritin-associated ferredoxin